MVILRNLNINTFQKDLKQKNNKNNNKNNKNHMKLAAERINNNKTTV